MKVVGSVLAAREPLPMQLFRHAVGHATSPDEEWKKEVLSPASGLLLIEEDVARPPHKSMGDWILNEAAGAGHAELALSEE